MAMTGAQGQGQEPVQERLKEQVSVSVKEALEKTTGILSNLHRVQSYLYVLHTVATTPASEGLSNALQQVCNLDTPPYDRSHFRGGDSYQKVGVGGGGWGGKT